MTLEELSKQIAVPLVISMVVGVTSILWGAGTQKTLLEQNIVATGQITKEVVELRLQNAVFIERFATKDQLQATEQRLMMLVQRSDK